MLFFVHNFRGFSLNLTAFTLLIKYIFCGPHVRLLAIYSVVIIYRHFKTTKLPFVVKEAE